MIRTTTAHRGVYGDMIKMISKAEARYQEAPKGTKRCRACSMFRDPQSCTLVIGKISPHGYCQHWEPKK